MQSFNLNRNIQGCLFERTFSTPEVMYISIPCIVHDQGLDQKSIVSKVQSEQHQ